jgi:hypothetical protein
MTGGMDSMQISLLNCVIPSRRRGISILRRLEITRFARRYRDQSRDAIKTILSALVAISVFTGVASTASAFDAKDFYEQVERGHYAKMGDWDDVGRNPARPPTTVAVSAAARRSEAATQRDAQFRHLACCRRCP